MATLTLENVTKQFGKKVIAVKNFNLEVQDREFLVLLGPSGCGKTTAMRMVAGLEEVTGGRIFIGDRDVTDLPPRKRNISMIFQNYAVWPHMTVYDNIAYALKLKRMSKAEIDKIVKEVAAMTSIEMLLDRYPSQLSGGQQQRVAVTRAIAVRPEIFLMDEPLSNLDAKLRVSMRTELKAIHNKTDATTVFVTHDQSEAMSMADRIVVMKDGEVIQVGLAQAGISTELQPVDYSTQLNKAFYEYDFDLNYWYWGMDPDPDFAGVIFLCEQLWWWNDSGYCDEEYDAFY